MSDYTPTTDVVRQGFAWLCGHGDEDGYDESRAEAFDRWLAQHDAEVAERAMRQAAETLAAERVNTKGFLQGRDWLNGLADAFAAEAQRLGGAS